MTCFGLKCPKTGHIGLCTSCATGMHAGLSSAILRCSGTLWWRSIFALFLFCTFFGRLWPNPMFLFSMGISQFFRTLDTCHVVRGPKPQTTAKLSPHNVVAQRFDWFCHLCAWARCAGAARWGTMGETAAECAKCPTSQIWGPNPGKSASALQWALEGPIVSSAAMGWCPNGLVVCKF